MDQKKPSEPPPGAAGQKPPDIKAIMADYDKAVKFFVIVTTSGKYLLRYFFMPFSVNPALL